MNFTEQLFMVSACLAWWGLHIAFAEASKQPQMHSDSWHAVFQEHRPGHTRTRSPAKARVRGPLWSQLSEISQPASNCSPSTHSAPSLDLATGDTERNQTQSLCFGWTRLQGNTQTQFQPSKITDIQSGKEPQGKSSTAKLLSGGET